MGGKVRGSTGSPRMGNWKDGDVQVKGLNHINIVARDLDRTIRFYEDVLGMRAQEIPNIPAGFAGCWINDEAGNPIVHVQQHNPERHGDIADRFEGMGAMDHVALTCADFEGMLARCEEMGLEYRVNNRQFGDLRQVFVTDPDGVVLELNFAGE